MKDTNKELIKLKKQLKKQKELSMTDDLTGLFNHRKLHLDLERFCYEKDRYFAEFTLMMIDIDGFKKINDERGHDAGDKFLTNIGKAINSILRKTDRAYRFGGDEFMIILPHSGYNTVYGMVRKLNKAMPVDWSYGTATGTDPEYVLKQADMRMYRHKLAKKEKHKIGIRIKTWWRKISKVLI